MHLDQKPHAAAGDGLATKQSVFAPFPVSDFGVGFDLGAPYMAGLHGHFDGKDADAVFVADYSSVLDVNSSNWTCAEVSDVLDSEVLHWASGGASAARAEPFADMEQQHHQQRHSTGYGGGHVEDDSSLEHKLSLPCQEQSLAHFDFNLEYF
ncbi:hypothetical protein ABZP36_013566 [Zizania latifolia]